MLQRPNSFQRLLSPLPPLTAKVGSRLLASGQASEGICIPGERSIAQISLSINTMSVVMQTPPLLERWKSQQAAVTSNGTVRIASLSAVQPGDIFGLQSVYEGGNPFIHRGLGAGAIAGIVVG